MLISLAFLASCSDDTVDPSSPDESGGAGGASETPAASECLTDCTPRIGIVSAFGAEADILLRDDRQENLRAFEVDPSMYAIAQTITPDLRRCGDTNPELCVATQPALKLGGVGISGSMFIANTIYREYVFETIGAELVDMETAALGQVAYANDVPYLAFRSVSDLAGGGSEEGESVGAFFGSGLAEANEARVTLAFLQAWAAK